MASWVVGLTGGIGSGKTTVANLFAARGAALVDTDLIAHELTVAGGEAMPAIRSAFGDAVIAVDGALDRAAMRRRAFADPAERKRLEHILHPLIRTISRERCAAAQAPYAMLVVPLLIESGDYRMRVDRLLVVDCPEDVQLARVMTRNGLPEPEVRAIMAAQASRAERLAAADDVIVNDRVLGEIDAEVDALHQQYLKLAHKVKAPS